MKIIKINGQEIFLNQVEYTVKKGESYSVEIPIGINPFNNKKFEGLELDEIVLVVRDILMAMNFHCNYFDYAIAIHHLEIAATMIKKKNHEKKGNNGTQTGLNKPVL